MMMMMILMMVIKMTLMMMMTLMMVIKMTLMVRGRRESTAAVYKSLQGHDKKAVPRMMEII